MNPKINNPTDGVYGYLALYNGRKAEVWSDSLYGAKKLAVAYFKVKPKNEHQVSVHLCEKQGEQVVHVAVD